MSLLDIWFDISNSSGIWSSGVGKDGKNNEKHDKECVKKKF